MSQSATIFDMDGVLVDSEPYWLQSREAFAAARGLRWTLEDQYAVMGRSTREWAAVMRERLALDMPPEAIADEVRAGVIDRLTARLPVLPGALEAVHAAASRGPVALASGSPTDVIDAVTALTGLDQVFQAVVYGDDMAHGKPAPDIYLEAARRLNIAPAACIGVEDSINGVRALHAAGMRIIAVPSPSFPLPADVLALADAVLPSLDSFTVSLIDGLAGSAA